MKKNYITSLFFALVGGLLFSLSLLAGKVEAAAPAWECEASSNNVTLTGNCFFGESEEEYKDLEFTIKNNNEEKKITSLYFKNIKTKRNNAISVSKENEYTFQIPVKTNINDIQTVEVYYILNNESKINRLTLDIAQETSKPVVEIKVNAENDYQKEYNIKVNVKDNKADDTGIKSIKAGFVVLGETANLETLPELETVANSSDWLLEYSFDMTYNGKEDVYLQVVVEDFAGNTTYATTSELLVDNDAPVINTSLTSSSDIKESHSIDINVTDAKSGIASVKYGWLTENQTIEDITLNTVALTKGGFRITTPSKNGVYRYAVEAIDNLGNTSTCISGNFEVSVGSNTIVPSFIGNTSEPASSFTAVVKVAKTDALAIEKIIMLWVPEGMAKPGHPANISDYDYYQEFVIENGKENEITFTTSQDMVGSYNLFMFIVYNQAENIFTTYDDATLLTIDTTAPKVYFTPAAEEYTKETNVTISLTDDNSFEESLFYAWAEASVELEKDQINEITTSGTVVSLTEVTGSYRLWVKAYDRAGNEVIATSEIYKLDNTAPTVSLTEEMKEIYGKTSEVSLEIVENDSGIASVKYAFVLVGEENPAEASYKENKENKVYTDVVNDGEYRLFVIITDKVGNETKAAFENKFLVDVKTPLIKGVSTNGYYKNEVTIEVEDGNLTNVNVCNLLTNECKDYAEKEIVLTETGYYVISATDSASNVTTTYFTLNREGSITIGEDSYKVKSQILLPVLENEGRYYISLPKGEYEKGNVLVYTKVENGTNKRLSQSNNYVLLEGEVIEILARRSDSITITDTDVASENSYVVVNILTGNEAKGLGINTTVIDNEALALTVGVAGMLSLIGIFVIYRSKKTLRV